MKSVFFKLIRVYLMALSMLATHYAYSHPDDLTDVLRQNSDSLFEDQAIYLHDYAVASFGNFFPYSSYPSTSLDAIKARLSVNDQSIGLYFGQFYGPAFTDQFKLIFSIYNDYDFQLINAVKANDNVQIQQILGQWRQFALAIGAYLHSLNPYIQANVVGGWLQSKINYEAVQIFYLKEEDFASAIICYDQSRAIARQLSEYITISIATQFGFP